MQKKQASNDRSPCLIPLVGLSNLCGTLLICIEYDTIVLQSLI